MDFNPFDYQLSQLTGHYKFQKWFKNPI